MHLRKAGIEEFYSVRDFYWDLIDKMKSSAYPIGWIKGIYPSDGYLRESIESQNLYVLVENSSIIACVIVNNSCNEGYEGIPWSIDCPSEEVLVLHALAVKPEFQGKSIGKSVVEDIIEIARNCGIKTIRLDILCGNLPAEKLYKSLGFKFVQTKAMFYEDTGWTDFSMYELFGF